MQRQILSLKSKKINFLFKILKRVYLIFIETPSEEIGFKNAQGCQVSTVCHRSSDLDNRRRELPLRGKLSRLAGNIARVRKSRWDFLTIFKTTFPSAGFTLLEMVVSVGIFSILIVTAIGIIISISNAETKSANIQNIQDNIRFTLELITKELRVGYGYTVSSCTGNACQQINFTTSNGEARGYCLGDGAIKKLLNTSICGFGSPMTSSNVVVDRLSFIVSGAFAGSSDGQPMVTVIIKVHSSDPRLQLESSMDVETTVVQRLRDI